jgi:biotin operon repressor
MSTEKAVTTAALKAALKIGKANGKSVETLVFELDTTERSVRRLVGELIDEGTPVCAHPAHGYYIAATWDEVEATYSWLHSRGLASLSKASKLRAAFNPEDVDPLQQLEDSGAFES